MLKTLAKIVRRLRGAGRPRAFACCLTIVSCILSPAVVGATTQSSTFVVTVNVSAACSIAANTLDFPAYSGALSQATTTISIACTETTPYEIGLDAGVSAGATVAARKMTSGADQIGYALFRDPAYSLNWGTTLGTDTETGTGTGVPVLATVYGQVAAGQLVPPGAYGDTVTATVSY